MPGVCPRCNREVYFAEERLALGKVWHTFCFSCRNCRKLLDSCSVVTHSGELFCKNCYVHLWPRNTRPSTDKAFRSENKPISISSPSTSITQDFLKTTASNSLNYPHSCRVEDRPTTDTSLEEKENYRREKCRLRGGGSEEEEEEVLEEQRETSCLLKEEKKPIENECRNADTINSITTISNSLSSPIAVTTWYNRQHSTSRSSTSALESHCGHKTSVTADVCCVKNEKPSVSRRSNDVSDARPRVPDLDDVDNRTNITDVQLRVGTESSTSADPDKHITTCRSDHKCNISHATIPSRRKFSYPPIPPPRSPLPSRRRVSFCDVVFGDRCTNDRCDTARMQDIHNKSCANNDGIEGHGNTYDVWRADDAAGKNSDGYEMNFTVNNANNEDVDGMRYRNVTTSCCNNAEENITRTFDESEKNYHRDREIENTVELCENNTLSDKDIDRNASSKEDLQGHLNALNETSDDDERMRGGCGGSCAAYPTYRRLGSSGCANSACSSPCVDRRGPCPTTNDRPICKKISMRCRQPCKGDSQICGAGGCCGSGCRGGCGKPGQTCMPSRPCTTPPCRARSPGIVSPCSPPRLITTQPPCCRTRNPVSANACGVVDINREAIECRSCCGAGNCGQIGKCGNCCLVGGGTSCCRSRSRAAGSRGCCINDGAKLTADGTVACCCRPKLSGCECFGGGLDCQRCGRKVYQAEMQIASGVPYHNICFSCFCCRKPLEPLTYQENCGEIYCKQCYVRNFGPQGYGYGVGAGALQTPL